MATTSAQVQQLYVAYLGRAADKAGLDYWLNELNADNATLTLENLRANFVNEQAEYQDAYAGLSRQDTVIKIYNNLFGRAPDAAGLTYWTTGGGANVNADQLLTAFVNGAAAADAKVITNKVLVSEVYTSTAGANYSQADAISILSGVTADSASVSAALIKLENGTLPGVAVPEGVAALKAQALAEKAVTDFEASKVSDLVKLNDAAVALNDTLTTKATLVDLVTPAAGTAQSYDDVDQAIGNATLVRAAVSGNTTASLEAAVTNANKAYDNARDTFTKAKVGNVDLVSTFEKAVTANAALKGADGQAVTDATAKVQLDFTSATTADATALAKANAAAGTSVTDAATLYEALTDGTKTAAQIKSVSDAFTTFLGTKGASDFNTLKSLATTDYTKNVAVEAEDTAEAAITAANGGNFLTANTNKIAADTTLANAKAADALVDQAKAIDVAHASLEESAASTTLPDYVVELTPTAVTTDSADLFHFDGPITNADFSLAGFAKGDALYFGEGYSFNSGALSTGDNNKLEYFFVQKGADVQVVFETKAFGSANLATDTTTGAVTNVAGAEDAAAVITLTGVTVAELQNNAGYIVHA